MELNLETWNLLFKLHLFCCFYLTGLILTIQAVHYPAYHFIDLNKFSSYQNFHMKWITPVVAPFMIVELITAFFLMSSYVDSDLIFWRVNFVSVVLIWAATFFCSVPAHNKLLKSYDYKAAQYLILTNWLRSLLWGLRSLVLLGFWVGQG